MEICWVISEKAEEFMTSIIMERARLFNCSHMTLSYLLSKLPPEWFTLDPEEYVEPHFTQPDTRSKIRTPCN